MKRGLIVTGLLVLIMAIPIVHGDATLATLNYDTAFASFTLNTAGMGLGVCVSVTATSTPTYATFYIDKTGNLAGATATYFIDSVASGTPAGNNCRPNLQIASTAPFDISNLANAPGGCPCTPSTQSAFFNNGTSRSVVLTTGQNIIVGVSLVTNPNGGTLNVFGNTQISGIQSLLCFGSVVGCGAGIANFALCNFVDNCIGYILYGNPGSTIASSPSPYGPNPPVYPCCQQVTTPALQGSSLRAPDVDSVPLIWLFFLLLALTLGSYLVVQAFKKHKNPRQYEIAI